MSSTYSAASADSVSVSRQRACKPLPSVSGKNSASKSLKSTGPTSRFMTTSKRLGGGHSMEQLTLFAEGTPASLLAPLDFAAVQKMKGTSGQRCLELYATAGHDGSLPKMLLDTLASVSTKLPHRWKLKASPSGRLLFQLAPSARRTGATGYGFLPTPKASRANRSGEGFGQTLTEALLPTPAASDSKGASRDRYNGSPKSHGNLREVLRSGPTDGIYPNPDFVAWMMGYPIAWLGLKRSATPSSRKSRSLSAKALSRMKKCKHCGKLQPKILQGVHASKLCWCDVVTVGKEKIWMPGHSKRKKK